MGRGEGKVEKGLEESENKEGKKQGGGVGGKGRDGRGEKIPLTTPGKMSFRFSAAAMALCLPPFTQSWNWNRLWRTGFEYEMVLLSTSVMYFTPHPCVQGEMKGRGECVCRNNR